MEAWSSEVSCLGPRDFEVALRWELAPEHEGREQRIEFSVLRQDFETAPHVFRVAVDARAREHRFRARLYEATTYYWRIVLPASAARDAFVSEPRSFLSPACPGADFGG